MKKILALLLLLGFMTSCSHGQKDWHAKKMAKKVEKYQSMDKNSNGKVTKKEWRSYADAKFKKIDTNKDNQITEAEYLVSCKKSCKIGCKKKCCTKKCGSKKCMHKVGKCDKGSCKLKMKKS